jgi:hypothetical protein
MASEQHNLPATPAIQPSLLYKVSGDITSGGVGMVVALAVWVAVSGAQAAAGAAKAAMASGEDDNPGERGHTPSRGAPCQYLAGEGFASPALSLRGKLSCIHRRVTTRHCGEVGGLVSGCGDSSPDGLFGLGNTKNCCGAKDYSRRPAYTSESCTRILKYDPHGVRHQP